MPCLPLHQPWLQQASQQPHRTQAPRLHAMNGTSKRAAPPARIWSGLEWLALRHAQKAGESSNIRLTAALTGRGDPMARRRPFADHLPPRPCPTSASSKTPQPRKPHLDMSRHIAMEPSPTRDTRRTNFSISSKHSRVQRAAFEMDCRACMLAGGSQRSRMAPRVGVGADPNTIEKVGSPGQTYVGTEMALSSLLG